MTISERIFMLLKERGMTECAFAKKIGITRASVNGWKRNGGSPSANHIMKICEVLEVTPEYLLSGKESKSDKKSVLTVKEKELVFTYEQVSPSTQKRMLEYAKRLKRMDERGEI